MIKSIFKELFNGTSNEAERERFYTFLFAGVPKNLFFVLFNFNFLAFLV